MANKHAPGPWSMSTGQWGDHSADGGGGFHILMGKYPGGIVPSVRLLDYAADIYPEDNGYSEAEANARLIAAAPEILGALKALVRQIKRDGFDNKEDYWELTKAGVAALEKAGVRG
jgi:hypothetical protein